MYSLQFSMGHWFGMRRFGFVELFSVLNGLVAKLKTGVAGNGQVQLLSLPPLSTQFGVTYRWLESFESFLEIINSDFFTASFLFLEELFFTSSRTYTRTACYTESVWRGLTELAGTTDSQNSTGLNLCHEQKIHRFKYQFSDQEESSSVMTKIIHWFKHRSLEGQDWLSVLTEMIHWFKNWSVGFQRSKS